MARGECLQSAAVVFLSFVSNLSASGDNSAGTEAPRGGRVGSVGEMGVEVETEIEERCFLESRALHWG